MDREIRGASSNMLSSDPRRQCHPRSARATISHIPTSPAHPPPAPAPAPSSPPAPSAQYLHLHHQQHAYSPNDYGLHWLPSPSSSVDSARTPLSQSLNTPTVTVNNDIISFGGIDQPLFDFDFDRFSHYSTAAVPLMQLAPSKLPTHTNNNDWHQDSLCPAPTPTRSHHHRESSLSSLGSVSPVSPLAPTIAHPLVVGDYYDCLPDFFTQQSKSLTPRHSVVTEEALTEEALLNQYTQNFFDPMGAYAMAEQRLAEAHSVAQKPSLEVNTTTPSPETMRTNSQSSPTTPEEKRKSCELMTLDAPAYDGLHSIDAALMSTMPKLSRTMTDIYSDELYNPSFHITSAPPSSTSTQTVATSPHNDVFSQVLQAASSQHLSASKAEDASTASDRKRSPFRTGSPLAPLPQSLEAGFASATQIRKQQKEESDAKALQEQIARMAPSEDNSQTVSPKDVNLVYRDNDSDASLPLFPVQSKAPSPPAIAPTNPRRTIKPEFSDSEASIAPSFRSMATTRQDSSSSFPGSSQASQPRSSVLFNQTHTPSIPLSMRMPNQYPFVPEQRRQSSNVSSTSHEFAASLQSMRSPTPSDYAEGELSETELQKPGSSLADTGTYTCTYHGCTLRFETPAKLQKHKRDGHRGSGSGAGTETESPGMTSTANKGLTQAGPHSKCIVPSLQSRLTHVLECERTNPSTGKPCNTIFSRPYDLTRHEDTIHNVRKRKVRCHLCTEEKTFSRNDALTRHFRVCHPEVESGKGRKRGVLTG